MIGTSFNLTRACGVICTLCLLLAALCTTASAIPKPVKANSAVAPGQTFIYNGDTSAKAAISIAPWGGGTVSIETSSDTQNGGALKIGSNDMYQGAVVTLKNPVTLPTSDAHHNWYVFVNLKVIQNAPDGSEASSLAPVPSILHQADYTEGNSFVSQSPKFRLTNDDDDRGDDNGDAQVQAPPPPAAGQMQRLYRRGNLPQNGFPGYTPNLPKVYSPDVPIVIPTVRLQFTLADGTTTDVERDLPAEYSQAPDEWMRIGVPVAALKFTNGITGPIQKITIGGIPAGTIWISQIGLVQDNAPITASAGLDQDVSKGDDVTLAATADGGLAALHYAWTFKASDGTLEEASGPTVTTSYNAGGTSYKVTLVVTDIDGIKPPVTTTTTVKVEE